MFGSIFFLSQFLQNVLHNTPSPGRRQAARLDGLDHARLAARRLFSERFGSRPFMVAGLALQAIALGWLATPAPPRR